MSVFDGDIDLNTTYMVDYTPKEFPKTPRSSPDDDNCLIIGLSRDQLKPKEEQKKYPDVLCTIDHEYYKDAVKRIEKKYPKVVKRYLSKDLDPQPILNDVQDLKRTEYLYSYCDRNLPFMSVNLARRAKALQTLRLPDDVEIPDTTQKSSYRFRGASKYKPPSESILRPARPDPATVENLRKILRVNTGVSTYTFHHGLLGKVILEKNPFGPPREEPHYGRWRNPFTKDYLWPNLPKKPGAGGGGAGGGGGGPETQLTEEELAFYLACKENKLPADCRCPQYGGEQVQLPPGKDGGGWSRTEMMGPLLDPKLYPARAGAAPETPTSRYDQPNAFLDKLQSKYPMLYSIMQNEASTDLKQRIDRDRGKSTYQVDYCEAGAGGAFENLQRAADESGTGPCAQPMRLPGDPCRVAPAPRKGVPKTISKQPGGGAGGDPRPKCETTSGTPPLGKTEYQDGVSKVGGIIMRDKLHHAKK